MFSQRSSKFWAVILAITLTGQALAAPVQPTCLFGGRNQQQKTDPQVLSLLQQITAQNAQMLALLVANGGSGPRQGVPSPTPIIIVPPIVASPAPNPPQQQIPIAGAPQYQIPIAGPPQQQIPISGAPQQQIIIHGAPQQQIPISGQPQAIPIQGAPQGQIPIGGPPTSPQGVPVPAPAPAPIAGSSDPRPPTGFIRYSLAQPTN